AGCAEAFTAPPVGYPGRTVWTIWFTGCSRIWKKGLGYNPIQNAAITRGAKVSISLGVRSCSFSFLGLATGPKNTRWYSHNRYAAAKITPATDHAAHARFSMNAPCRIVNSPMKPFRSGNPIEDRNMIIVMVAYIGITLEIPPYSEISR